MRPSLLAIVVACRPPERAPDEPAPEPSEPTAPSSPTETSETADTAPEPPEPAGPQNVLLVMFDDVSVFDVGTYGLDPAAPPTPTLDALAAEGVTFRHAWGTPLCSPSRAALLTGRHPGRTGIGYTALSYDVGPSLSPDETTLAEVLAGAPEPRDTSVIGKWNLTSGEHPDPYGAPGEHGFAWFVGTVGNIGDSMEIGDPFPNGDDYYRWTKNDNGTPVVSTVYATTDNADDAVARIGAMQEPWFLYLPFNAPHSPYQRPPAELVPGITDTAPTIDKARAMLQAADIELGRVLASINPEVRARTTVIVLGDNGTDPNLQSPPAQTWKFSVYERGVNVPLIVSGPQVAAPGTQSDALVSIVDLFPTIAEIAGAELPDVPLDGVSLVPILRDPTATVREQVFTQAFFPNGDRPEGRTMALRDARYKLVVTRDWPFFPDQANVTELYDLEGVDVEGADLADDPAMAEVRDRLSAALSDLMASFEEDPLRQRP